MLTFTVSTSSEIAYDKIMKYLTENSLMFSRNGNGFEIIGNVDHYKYFENEIKEGRIYAFMQEMI
jgi:hypothetical protein